MTKILTMPRLRPEMEKGTLAAWLKEPGETFAKGEPIYEIETDKVVNQIEADQAGVMKSQLVEEGDQVYLNKIGGMEKSDVNLLPALDGKRQQERFEEVKPTKIDSTQKGPGGGEFKRKRKAS